MQFDITHAVSCTKYGVCCEQTVKPMQGGHSSCDWFEGKKVIEADCIRA